MPNLKAGPLAIGKAHWMVAVTGLTLLALPGCSPVLVDQKDQGLSLQKALEAQRLPPSLRRSENAPQPPAASELKPAYDRYLLPPPATSFTPQLP
ncbi:MAG: hypothetical protein Q7U05_13880 [Polaromonas sp.]|nr:hypothetical protein [Polaromonas sp.]